MCIRDSRRTHGREPAADSSGDGQHRSAQELPLEPVLRFQERLRDVLNQGGIVGAAALLLGGLATSGISESIDLLLYDAVTSLRSTSSAPRHPVTIVGIDEGDIAYYGWPIDDAVLCRALQNALQAKASAIGLDLYRDQGIGCLLYTSPSPRDLSTSRMPSSA